MQKNHVKKIIEIGFSKKTVLSRYENLRLKNSAKQIFYYTAHGIKTSIKVSNLQLCFKKR